MIFRIFFIDTDDEKPQTKGADQVCLLFVTKDFVFKIVSYRSFEQRNKNKRFPKI